MKLYLAHHGDAVPKELDPERPLTSRGREDVARVADFLARAGVVVERVIHSDKVRAVETARILAAAAAPGVLLEMRPDIRPDDPVEPLLGDLVRWDGGILIAGHGPFLSRLVTQLLAVRGEPPVIATQPGSVFCLERGADGSWQLDWMVRPELLG